MIGMKVLLGAAALVGVMAAAGSVQAAVIVKWNTCEGNSTNCDIDPPGSNNLFTIKESPRTPNNNVANAQVTFSGYDVSNATPANRHLDSGGTTLFDPTRDVIVRAFRSQTNDGATSKSTNSGTSVNQLFEGGLGVKSPSQNSGPSIGDTYLHDGSNESGSPNHAVDNIGYDEFLVFEFGNDDYIPLSFMIGWANNSNGVDILTYIGGSFGDGLIADLAAGAIGLGDLASLVFVEEAFTGSDDVTVGESVQFTKGASGRYLIIAANTGETEQSNSFTDWFQVSSYSDCNPTKYLGTNHTTTSSSGKKYCKYKPLKDKGDDAFKVTQVIGQLSPPRDNPEPATLGLLALGLAGMGYAARRRKAA